MKNKEVQAREREREIENTNKDKLMEKYAEEKIFPSKHSQTNIKNVYWHFVQLKTNLPDRKQKEIMKKWLK